MAYSRVWNSNSPTSADAANQLATIIDNKMFDVEERMAALVTGFSTSAPTDPVVPLPAISGKVGNKTLYLNAAEWLMRGNSGTDYASIVGSGGYIQKVTAGNQFGGAMSISLGTGAVLQNVKMTGKLNVGSTLVFGIYRVPFVGAVAPTGVQVGTNGVFVANGLWQVIPVGGAPLGHAILTGNSYQIFAAGSNAGGLDSIGLGDVEITYDIADSTQLV